MFQQFKSASDVNLCSETSPLFAEIPPEESAAINGGFGFFKKIGRGLKSAVKAFGEGASHFILNEMMNIARNPWGFATGGQQRDVTELDVWSSKD